MALVVKNLLAKHRRHKRPGIGPWVEKMPWRRRWQPTPVGNPMGRAAWQVADKDKTERAHAGNFTFVYHFVFSKFYISMNLICMIKMMECITTVLN